MTKLLIRAFVDRVFEEEPEFPAALLSPSKEFLDVVISKCKAFEKSASGDPTLVSSYHRLTEGSPLVSKFLERTELLEALVESMFDQDEDYRFFKDDDWERLGVEEGDQEPVPLLFFSVGIAAESTSKELYVTFEFENDDTIKLFEVPYSEFQKRA